LKTVTKKSRQVPPAVGTNVCGSNILATVTADNKCYFSPNHVCEALGVAWSGQYVKIKADPVLSSVIKEILTTARDGKSYKYLMLPIEFLSGWLFTIKKVAPEVQAKLNLYRKGNRHACP
jgi:hypothetical protein